MSGIANMTSAAAERADLYRIEKSQLGELIDGLLVARRDQLTVAYVGDIEEYAPAPAAESLVLHLTDPTAPSGTHDFNIGVLDEGSAGRRPVLVVYAAAGLLSLWDRLEEDVDEFLHGRRQVSIVFLQERFSRISLASHSYFLSALLSALPRRKFVTCLATYLGGYPEGASARPTAQSGNSAAIESNAPTDFSALVISVKPRKWRHGIFISIRFQVRAALTRAAKSLLAVRWRL
jgi:hypothetical protein